MRVIFFFLILTLSITISCNPAKRIVAKKDISEECKESIVWLYNSFEKKNGLLKVKIDNYEQDTAFQIELWKRFSNCTLGRNLNKEEVKKLYGKPNKITPNIRNQEETYYYSIISETCRDTFELKKSNHTCGHLRFTFDQDGTPVNGYLQLINYGDLD